MCVKTPSPSRTYVVQNLRNDTANKANTPISESPIKVGGEPTGVDEDGERFPEVATLPKTSKKGFFGAKKEEGEA